jgi:catechol 2,3-dioxygenase-like lactoylglutathione lyase family enzyme
MSIDLNHTIVAARDKKESADFLATILGLSVSPQFGPFIPVETGNGVTLDFMDAGSGDVHSQHYAFLVTESEFDAIFERIQQARLTWWADPHHQHAGEINHNDGGRGLYFEDPSGHNLEIITRPYGSGG